MLSAAAFVATPAIQRTLSSPIFAAREVRPRDVACDRRRSGTVNFIGSPQVTFTYHCR